MSIENKKSNRKTLGASATVCANCFGVLGIKSRMKIYSFIKDQGPSTVSDVVDMVGLTQPTVSYHLKSMKDTGLLNSQKKGKEVYYSIREDCPVLEETCILKHISFK